MSPILAGVYEHLRELGCEGLKHSGPAELDYADYGLHMLAFTWKGERYGLFAADIEHIQVIPEADGKEAAFINISVPDSLDQLTRYLEQPATLVAS